MNLKQLVADHAVQHVVSGMKLGLGTGSTVYYVVEALAQRMQAGTLQNIVGIPTSEATAQQAQKLGIPLTTLEESPRLDLTIDGADEVDPHLQLIKGLGGALLREKIVALASERVLIVIDESKRVAGLGTKAPLPVEVVTFGWSRHVPLLQSLGTTPVLRTTSDGQPVITDNGNYVIDAHFPEGISDPHAIAETLKQQTGIVDHGLFLNIATEAHIATATGVTVLTRPT